MHRADKSSLLTLYSNLHNFLPLQVFEISSVFRVLKIAFFSLSLCSYSPTLRNFIPFSLQVPKNRVFLSLSLDLHSFLCASDKMDVREKLFRLRFHLIFAALGILVLAALLYLAPSLLTLLSYFWPLLLSTALFLAAVFLFHRISPPESDASTNCKAGEQILDYVAGQPEVASEIKDSEEEEDKDAKKSE